MRAHLDPARRASTINDNKSLVSTKDSIKDSNGSELTGAAAVHKMAQLESNFLAQSLSGGMQNLFGAKAAAAAAAFAGLAQQQHQQPITDRNRIEDTKSKLFVYFLGI